MHCETLFLKFMEETKALTSSSLGRDRKIDLFFLKMMCFDGF